MVKKKRVRKKRMQVKVKTIMGGRRSQNTLKKNGKRKKTEGNNERIKTAVKGV